VFWRCSTSCHYLDKITTADRSVNSPERRAGSVRSRDLAPFLHLRTPADAASGGSRSSRALMPSHEATRRQPARRLSRECRKPDPRPGSFPLQCVGRRHVPRMRLQRQTFLKEQTVLGPRCLSISVGWRCVTFPVLARRRALNRHRHNAFTPGAWRPRALNSLSGAVSTGRTVQLLTSRDHSHTTVVSSQSTSDRLEAPRLDALVDCSDRRVCGCLDSPTSSRVSEFPTNSWVSGFPRHRSPAVNSEQAPLRGRFAAEQAWRAYR
jgi:hypothetical protein